MVYSVKTRNLSPITGVVLIITWIAHYQNIEIVGCFDKSKLVYFIIECFTCVQHIP
jgi:hypothetical protein